MYLWTILIFFYISWRSVWLCWIFSYWLTGIPYVLMKLAFCLWFMFQIVLCIVICLCLSPLPGRIFLFSCNHIYQVYSFTACGGCVLVRWACPHAQVRKSCPMCARVPVKLFQRQSVERKSLENRFWGQTDLPFNPGFISVQFYGHGWNV